MPEGSVNLARLLAGSEGTLAVVTEATVSLEPVPETKSMALLTYDDSTGRDARPRAISTTTRPPSNCSTTCCSIWRATPRSSVTSSRCSPAGRAGPPRRVLRRGRRRRQGASRGPPRRPRPGRSRSGADRRPGEDGADRHANARDRSRTTPRARAFWKLRKSGLPILLSRTTDEKHVSFIEDTAVPPEHLAGVRRALPGRSSRTTTPTPPSTPTPARASSTSARW